jgi:hypothetical protein
MNYVIAVWICCAVILVTYTLRTVRRERSLRRSLASGGLLAPKRPMAPGPAVATSGPAAARGTLAPEETGTWT